MSTCTGGHAGDCPAPIRALTASDSGTSPASSIAQSAASTSHCIVVAAKCRMRMYSRSAHFSERSVSAS